MLAVVLLNLAQKEARLELQQSSTSAGVVYDWVPPCCPLAFPDFDVITM